jgi:hypothetical protein
VALLSLTATACSGDSKIAPFPSPPHDYAYAYSTPDCAPWDGPAVTLFLQAAASDSLPPVGRHLQISIFVSLDQLSGQSLSWPTDARKGSLLECASPGSCSALKEGKVHITEVSSDSTVWGEVSLLRASGDRIQGGFRALWKFRRIACG